MKIFRKLPIEVQAVRWTGKNSDEMTKFAGDSFEHRKSEETALVFDKLHNSWINVFEGNWIIKGIKGEFYPIDHDVLMQTYAGLCFLCNHPDSEHVHANVGACSCGCDGPLDGP